MLQKRRFPGRFTKCPACCKKLLYSWVSGMSSPGIHFYANESNDILIRTEWFENIEILFRQRTSDTLVYAAVHTMLEGVPGAHEKYSIWSNVKCPHCWQEFPYKFKGNLKLRLCDSEVVIINGCQINGDEGLFEVEVEPIN